MKPIGRVPDALIQKMQADVDIVAIIGKHTSLKKRGNEFVGCCPFHQEKRRLFRSIHKKICIIAMVVAKVAMPLLF